MVEIQFSTYYRFGELTRILQHFEMDYPQLVRLESIGQSYEGRDMTVLQINRAEDDAPTVWVEAGKRKRCRQTAVKIDVQLFSKEP